MCVHTMMYIVSVPKVMLMWIYVCFMYKKNNTFHLLPCQPAVLYAYALFVNNRGGKDYLCVYMCAWENVYFHYLAWIYTYIHPKRDISLISVFEWVKQTIYGDTSFSNFQIKDNSSQEYSKKRRMFKLDYHMVCSSKTWFVATASTLKNIVHWYHRWHLYSFHNI